MLNKSTQTEE